MNAKTLLISNVLIVIGFVAIMLCVLVVLFLEHTVNACIILQLEDYVESEFIECMGDNVPTQIQYAIVGIFGLFMLAFGLMLNKTA